MVNLKIFVPLNNDAIHVFAEFFVSCTNSVQFSESASCEKPQAHGKH